MVKGMYHYLAQAWKNPDPKVLRERMIGWRESNAVTRVDKPLRLDRARALGYKDKKGFVIARVRINRGGRKNTAIKKGRRSKRQSVKKILKMNYKWVAEQRAARKFKNLEVLNSYQIGKDGKHYFFEIILVDKNQPEIQNDKTINWICHPSNQGRVFRGLTSSAKKSRGLRKKSRELKVRPSLRSNDRLGR